MTSTGYFVSGKLVVNNRVEHCFFDIKVRKQQIKKVHADGKKYFTIRLFTSDLPTIPIDEKTTLKAEFRLEKIKSSMEDQDSLHVIAEAHFDGSLFKSSPDHIRKSSGFVSVTHELSDWHFMVYSDEKKKEKKETMVLYFMSVRMPISKVKKFGYLL
mmetsp:Transcript_41659/g.58125  ORF Transcript_41659/g.58125 Transcript_41659/m.58125 type:complete len:157 (-) Transcript_41659:42-512(-)